MPNLQFHQFACLSDNYGVLVHDPQSRQTASIDAPDAGAVKAALAEKSWILSHIFVTHHHWDHTQGIAELKNEFGCHVIGPAGEAGKIETLDQTVEDGSKFKFGGDEVRVLETPGHTLGMVNYHFTGSGVVFTGDTLFALGCGRVFEGDMEMMWNSLEKLTHLPPETTVYCGHEYTQANAAFALTIDPENGKLVERAAEIEHLRSEGKPTLPTTIGLELATNPFLRAADPGIRSNLGMQNATDAEVFTEIRTRKDNA